MTVIDCCSINAARSCGVRLCLALVSTTEAPVPRGSNSSNRLISKEMEVIANHASLDCNPRVDCIASNRQLSACTPTSTPFGLPVEPEVYKI